MDTLISILVAIVALEHIYIMYIEMFARESQGPKIFKSFDADFFSKTKVLAANQGLYNGFLAAGLLRGVYMQDYSIILFFLVCILVAGIYGGFTASKSILRKQALPAMIVILIMGYDFYIFINSLGIIGLQ